MKGAAALLLCASSLACAADGAFQPASPDSAALQPAVEWTLRQAPRDWIRMKLTYAWRDSLARARVYVMGPHTRRWREVASEDDASIYGFFDELLASQAAKQAAWSAATITVFRDTRQYEVSYCRATPTPDDTQLIIGNWGC